MHKELSYDEWQTFLQGLREEDEQLLPKDQASPDAELVDAYVFSGHAEAMQSSEIDGDLWGTLADIESSAQNEEEAWQKIVEFYTERNCLLLKITDTPELEEWIINEELAQRIGLI